MKHWILTTVLASMVIGTTLAGTAHAKVSAEEAARLGNELTPVGAKKGSDTIKVGSHELVIPEYTGGDYDPDYKRGDNPYEDDKPIFTITSENYEEYSEFLAEGYKALFQTFPDSYTMDVYPSRRSGAYPQWFLDESAGNASRAVLTNEGNGIEGAARGFPFPIPGSGREVIWNHIMRYNTLGYRGYINNASTTPDGDYVVERAYLEFSYVYNHPKATPENISNRYGYGLTKVVEPANKAGDSYLLHIPIDRIAETTGVWIYNPAQQRVRRVGEVGYDNPLFDGLMTHDQIDMFNGPLDRYTVKLIGKKEMLVPYNSYPMYSPDVKYKEIITKGHINQKLTRYELHRTWVIEANVREGFQHNYKKRVFYLDEDSWLVLGQDIYDDRDQFWRFSEAHAINFPEVPVVVNGVQVHYDIQSRRYVIINMTNEEEKLIEYDYSMPKKYYSTQNLKKFSRRNY